MGGDEGWQNAETILDEICNNLYGNGMYANSARSLNLEDIDKLSNYNKTSFRIGLTDAYGNKMTYSWSGTGRPYYKGENGVRGSLGVTYSNFHWFDEESNSWKSSAKSTTATTNAKEEIDTVKSDSYWYNITDNITTWDGYRDDKVTEIVNMITNGYGTDYAVQWLANRTVNCSTNYINYMVMLVNRNVEYQYMYNSNNSGAGAWNHVRPVVSLVSNISITGIGENIGTEENMWSIIAN